MPPLRNYNPTRRGTGPRCVLLPPLPTRRTGVVYYVVGDGPIFSRIDVRIDRMIHSLRNRWIRRIFSYPLLHQRTSKPTIQI